MIRPVTLLTFAAFIGSGLYLYQVKHQAQLVDREIDKVHAAADMARDRARLLQSEYARLNDPERLSSLAAAYVVDLKPTQPGQWSSMAEIDRRLPSVGGPAAEPAPLEPPASVEVPTAAAGAPRPAPRTAQVGSAQVASSQWGAPTIVATAVAARPLPRTTAAPRLPPAQPNRATLPAPLSLAPAPVQVAATPLPVLRPASAPMPSLLPRVSPPTGASVLAISTRPSAQTDPYARPSAPMVASALGMARTMNQGASFPPGTVR
jgi:hypothetical protein